MAEFQAFPKIPRLNRDITVTEKIDGTNAAVIIEEWDIEDDTPESELVRVDDGTVSQWYRVQAQSRKRLITPEADNHGFAGWVRENAEELVLLMGPGRHFGEWWGSGIQRGYGQDVKRFSLFNPTFHFGLPIDQSPLLRAHYVDTVPVLYEGPFSERAIKLAVDTLALQGSQAAPGFMNPEGVIIFHTASRSLFKVTIKDDEKPKGSTE